MAAITAAERLRRRATPKEYLDGQDSTTTWDKYLNSADDRVSFDCWKYLHDRVYGKPAQAVDMNVKGNLGVELVNSVPRPKRG